MILTSEPSSLCYNPHFFSCSPLFKDHIFLYFHKDILTINYHLYKMISPGHLLQISPLLHIKVQKYTRKPLYFLFECHMCICMFSCPSYVLTILSCTLSRRSGDGLTFKISPSVTGFYHPIFLCKGFEVFKWH